MTIFYKS